MRDSDELLKPVGIDSEKGYIGRSGKRYETKAEMRNAGDAPNWGRELKLHKGKSGQLYETVTEMRAVNDDPSQHIINEPKHILRDKSSLAKIEPNFNVVKEPTGSAKK